MIAQISIFAENRKGTMQTITGILADENINISALVTNDSAEFGIIRLIASEPEKARDLLSAAGYLCKLEYVLGIDIKDEPGGLNRLLRVIENSNTNIDYLYISYDRNDSGPIAIVKAPEPYELEACIRSNGFCTR